MNNTSLEKRIQELEKWKSEKEKQQIKFPLDIQSISILNKYFMRILSSIQYEGGASGNTFLYHVGVQDNYTFQVEQNTFVPYTVDTTTDFITVATKARYEDNQPVILFTSNTDASNVPPSPLVSGTGVAYYVRNPTADGQSFQLSTTSGGAAINITTSGVGQQYLVNFQ